MNAAEELAKLFKERDNGVPYSPVSGTVIEVLPGKIKIRINDKVILDEKMLLSTVDLYMQDNDENYIWQGKRVYLLPFLSPNTLSVQKYLVLGGDAL